MVGVIIMSHGNLASTLVATAETIIGKIEDIKCIAIRHGDNLEDIRKSTSLAIRDLDTGMGVLILTDMFGGTPSNIGLSFLEDDRVEVLTGVNLSMLLKLSSHRQDKNLTQLAGILKTSGQNSIVIASEMLKGRQGGG
ncbi:MAG: PTS sugar transporter [Deltaproteobacteria bacterium]|nr:PTS sugar transporter [Deltaproteobacteria bacterium]